MEKVFEKPQDECGVFGIYSNDVDINLYDETVCALYALQHRGFESCGIAINKDGEFSNHKGVGTISYVMDAQNKLREIKGKIAIGHVCYASNSHITRAFAQPLVMRYLKGELSLAHNGAISNFAKLHKELQKGGAIFQSNSDAELIAYIIGNKRVRTLTIEDAVIAAANDLKGAFSLVISSPSKLIGVRDKNGFRPLCIGKLKNSYVICSESCALDSIGATFVRDVEPGEVVVIDDKGIKSYKYATKQRASICMFEYVYLSRPDSVLEGLSVHKARRKMGKMLAELHPVDADMVCGVPDSGVDAALGYSEQSGIPVGFALIKNEYIRRMYSNPNITQDVKDKLLKVKINVLKPNVKGKKIIIVDDSIVKGSTAKHIITILKQAGAKEVHMRISSPPFAHDCYYGTHLKGGEELIAKTLNVDEICKEIGADSLGYLNLESFEKIGKKMNIGYCDACFSGKYPASIPTEKFEDKFSRKIVQK